MSFLYPSFLWALGVLAIPVIIHLFNFRKTKRVYFSNTRFLKQVKEATTAKRKLKHYLILLSRLLMLLFLVLTFAQPIIPAQEQLTSTQSILLYLDNSQSMSAQLEDNTRGLESGISFVKSIVDVFPADTRYKIITNDFAPYSNSYKTRTEILDLVTQIRFSSVSRSMQEVLDRISQDQGLSANEVFWISDLQKSTLGKIPAIDSTMKIHLVPISYKPLANVFVDSAFLENPFAAGGEKNVLHVKVRNEGDRDVDQLNLKLSLNSIQAGGSSVNIPAKGSAETTFDLSAGLSGLNQAKVTFNDFPVTFDNEFFMALNFTDRIRIIEIKGTTTGSSIEKVFGNEKIFSYKGFSVSNFNYNALAEANLVVVNGLNAVDQALAAALRGYISNGGTMLFFPGQDPDVANLKSLLLLPQLSRPEKAEVTELSRPDFDNPFFSNVFEEKSRTMAMPNARAGITWGNDRSAILRFKNDAPFLSRFDQTGQLFVVASALQNEFTDFYNHALFVPVMYRVASSSKREEVKPYYTLNQSFLKLRIDSLITDEPLKLVGSEELIPTQRKVDENVFIDIPKFSISPGFYKVVSQRDTISLIAFNLDKSESLMDQFIGEQLKQQLSMGDNISIFEAASAEAFSNEIKERYLGTPLWKYALLMAILFVVMEILLVRFLK